MWRVASSIPLNGLILFFGVWIFVALLAIVKVRSDASRTRAAGARLPAAGGATVHRSWTDVLLRPTAFLLAPVFAAVGSFVTCFALNYSSLHQYRGPADLVDDDKSYDVRDWEKGGSEIMTGRDVKARYGADMREDGTRVSDDNRRTFGDQVLDMVDHHEAEQRAAEQRVGSNDVQPAGGSAAP